MPENFLGVKNDFITKVISLGIFSENFIPKKLKIVEIGAFKVHVKLDFCDFCDFLFVFKNYSRTYRKFLLKVVDIDS